MKKAFTLSEALVTLAIIAVLAAILIPVINNVRPDKDRITYKKALYSVNTAVATAMDSSLYSIASNSSAYWKDENISDSAFCSAVADALNTSGAVDCTSTSSYESPNFITTDGIRFWGLEGKFGDDDTRIIYVDRALTSSEINTLNKHRGGKNAPGLQIRVRYDGKIDTPSDDSFDFENELIENSLQVSSGKKN